MDVYVPNAIPTMKLLLFPHEKTINHVIPELAEGTNFTNANMRKIQEFHEDCCFIIDFCGTQPILL